MSPNFLNFNSRSEDLQFLQDAHDVMSDTGAISNAIVVAPMAIKIVSTSLHSISQVCHYVGLRWHDQRLHVVARSHESVT